MPVVKQKQIQQPTAFSASLQAAQFYNEALLSGQALPMASQMPTVHQYQNPNHLSQKQALQYVVAGAATCLSASAVADPYGAAYQNN